MAHYTSTRLTDTEIEIFEQYWQPDGKPKAVICLIHGLGEHSSRYRHLAEYYIKRGYIVAAYDLRGHGQSQGQRGHYPSLDAVMDDIQVFIEKLEKDYPELPVFLYGHSLGGVFVLNYVLRNKNHLTGVIATSPGLVTGQKVAPWKLTSGKCCIQSCPLFQCRTDWMLRISPAIVKWSESIFLILWCTTRSQPDSDLILLMPARGYWNMPPSSRYLFYFSTDLETT